MNLELNSEQIAAVLAALLIEKEVSDLPIIEETLRVIFGQIGFKYETQEVISI